MTSSTATRTPPPGRARLRRWHDNVVLGGVDVVAYFSLEAGAAPVWGKADYATAVTSVDGLDGNSFQSVFWFATEENARLFEASPSKYAPRFGGFCSYGMSSEFARDGEAPMASANATSGWAWAKDSWGAGEQASGPSATASSIFSSRPSWTSSSTLRRLERRRRGPLSDLLRDVLGRANRSTPSASSLPWRRRRGPAFNPKLAGILSPKALEDDCADQLNATCGAYGGDDRRQRVLRVPTKPPSSAPSAPRPTTAHSDEGRQGRCR